MNFDEAYKLDDELNNLYLTDKEKTSTERLVRGLQILSKYSNDIPSGAAHDIIYICLFPVDMPIEEIEELYKLGFHLDADGFWVKFT